MSWLRKYRIDLAFGGAGLAFSLVSLWYPFGRDQGLYYYVAREWVLRGAIPYRDVLDHKTPGIYILYALAVRLFGETMWGIRVIDIAGVVAAAMVASWLAANRGERVPPGVRGATFFGAAILYWGHLNFWNTAQTELWYSTLGVAAVATVIHRRSRRAALIAGLLTGAALLMKPPAIWFACFALVELVRRTWRERQAGERLREAVAQVVAFGAGAAIIVGVVLGYFAAKGAMPALIDIVVGANGYYVKHERGPSTLAGIAEAVATYVWLYTPLLPALLFYLGRELVASRRRRDAPSAERHWTALLLLVCALAAVSMQGKFYLLHWTVIVPPMAVILANAIRTLVEVEPRRRTLAWIACAPALLLLWGLGFFTARAPHMWWLGVSHTYRWKTGLEQRSDFSDHYQEPSIGFHFKDSEAVGLWLEQHSSPDDLLTVRGFEPQIYAVARRRHHGRFFWTTFLTSPVRAYRREEWLQEDLDALLEHPPRFVVALNDGEGRDAPAFFTALGYRTVFEHARFNVLERGGQP